MKKFVTIVTVFVTILALLATSAQTVAQEPEMGPDEVIQAVYGAVEAKDIDAAMELVAEDAVLVLIPPPDGLDGTFVGKEEIRAWWDGLAQDNGRAEFSDITVSGNVATWKAKWWSDEFAGMGVAPAEFEGINIVQGGLFKSAAWVFTEEFLASMEAATPPEALPGRGGEVIQAVYGAVEAKDIDAAMELVAEDAVLVLIPPPDGLDGTFVGKEEIRAWWEGLAQDNGRAEFSDITVSGNAATWKAKWWSDEFAGMGAAPAEFEGGNIVQGGLFKSTVWVFTEEFLAGMEAATPSPAALPESGGTTSTVYVALVLGGLALAGGIGLALRRR